MGRLLIVAVALLLGGCIGTDATRQERRQVRETATVTGSIAGMPVDVRASSMRTETADAVEHSETGVPGLDTLASAAPAMLGQAAGAGFLGPLAGLLGIGAGLLAWCRGRQASNTLGRVVDGIETAKAALPAPAVDALHVALSRRLDAADKRRVRRLRLHDNTK